MPGERRVDPRPTSKHDLAEIRRVLSEVAFEVRRKNPWLSIDELVNEGYVWIFHRWKYYRPEKGAVAGFVAFVARKHLYELATRTCPTIAYAKGRRKKARKLAFLASYEEAIGASLPGESSAAAPSAARISVAKIEERLSLSHTPEDNAVDTQWALNARQALACLDETDCDSIELLLQLAAIDSTYAKLELKRLMKRVACLRAYARSAEKKTA